MSEMNNVIKIKIKGKVETEIVQGTTLLELSKNYQDSFTSPIMGARVNNRIKGLTYQISEPCNVEFLDMTNEDGMRIYRRSLAFILSLAVHELYPDGKVTICHSLSKGLYCEFKYKEMISEEILKKIEKRMHEIVERKLAFNRQVISIQEAKSICEKECRIDLIHLVEHRSKPHITLYECGGLTDCYYGYLLPDTSYIKLFELKYYPPGFIIRFPQKEDPSSLPAFIENKKLFNIFNEYKRWGKIMEVENVGMLNDIIAAREISDLIRISEGLYEKKIAQVADMIAQDPNKRIVLIAGPSSSGKTTSAQRLGIQLRVNCLKPVMISLDNYFLDRDRTPIDENGEYDFESLDAIDVQLFNEHLKDLLEGKEVEIPIFNFAIGSREKKGTKLKISDNQIVIIEGIHGLNERLTESIDKKNKFKIYVSALTSLSIDDHNRIPTTDTRIIRRIVRDSQYRNHDALSTIKRWPSVRRGEEANIFPFQEEADVMLNSALIYELGVLKTYAEPLLQVIDETSPEYSEARRLLNFLSYFLPIGEEDIPITSIVREFIGGGCFCR
ncbi:MAG: nucleoside kinase [Deltaproteobacteria bacterium]